MTPYALGILAARRRGVPVHLKQAFAQGFADAFEKRAGVSPEMLRLALRKVLESENNPATSWYDSGEANERAEVLKAEQAAARPRKWYQRKPAPVPRYSPRYSKDEVMAALSEMFVDPDIAENKDENLIQLSARPRTEHHINVLDRIYGGHVPTAQFVGGKNVGTGFDG